MFHTSHLRVSNISRLTNGRTPSPELERTCHPPSHLKILWWWGRHALPEEGDDICGGYHDAPQRTKR